MMDHEAITRIVAAYGYGKGICPNPFVDECDEWMRRKKHTHVRAAITAKIESLYEPRFITPPETAECIEALITMTDSRKILEIGTCTGFTTLHMLRAVYGKAGARIVSIDSQPNHDQEWWEKPEFKEILRHIEVQTPESLQSPYFTPYEMPFDLVYIDSDHSSDHTRKEMEALEALIRPGTVILAHDLPKWSSLQDPTCPEVRDYFVSLLGGPLDGCIMPTARQADLVRMWGPDYPKECSPHLGIFIKR